MLDCLVNGEISQHLPTTDRGLLYGDGVFETLAVLGGMPRFWQLHMDRLALGCERLGFAGPQQALLLREVQTVAAGHPRCVVRITVTRGSSGRGYRPPTEASPNRIVASFAWPQDLEGWRSNGIAAHLCEFRLGLQPELAGLKHLNRLEYVLAAAELSGSNCQEGVVMDTEGYVIGGVSSNLFAVGGGLMLTPRMDRCGVRGVMRSAILQAFKPNCEQRRLTLDMLPEAEELFLCNAVRGVIPLTRVGHWNFKIGQRTRELQDWLEQQ